jgi:plastocyanin
MKPVFRFLLMVSVCLASTSAVSAASNHIVRARAVGGTTWVWQPTNVVIAVGDTVTWTNFHSVAHDTTAGITNSGTNNGWASAPLAPASSGETFPFTFTVAGNYPYRCRIHADFPPASGQQYHPEQTGLVMVVSMNLAPIISLTNPAPDTKFVAPATLNLQASATDDGTVTGVQFLMNGSPLGTVNAAPFELLTASLGAGNYTFAAIATDNGGLSSTSAPVPVFLLTNSILTNIALSNGTAQFTVLGIAGQTYIFDTTVNLSNWQPFATSVAPANVFQVLDPAAAAFSNRNYRSRQTAP